MGPGRISRRRFVTGALVAGAAAAMAPWSRCARSAPVPQQVLSGIEFDLAIAPLPVNFTGAARTATAVNGSIPAPVLRWREGSTVTLRVANRLPVTTSIHWHGILVPFEMDGVPGISFGGIPAGQTFVYRFPVRQNGTFWYHSHSAFQEQTGLYGPLIIDPPGEDPIKADRDYVVMLSDWTDEEPTRIFEKLKVMSDYYNYQLPTAGDFFRDVRNMGLAAAIEKRSMWNRMRMNPTDLIDISAATYTYLVNGAPPDANWTAIARKGERIRLRFINGSANSIFDVRIPGLKLVVVSADGQPVDPVTVDEFRISTAETYDLIVTMPDDAPYTIFAQSIDRVGYARATLAPQVGLAAPVPPLDPRTWLTMADMGMDDMKAMPAHDSHGTHGSQRTPGHEAPGVEAAMSGGGMHGARPEGMPPMQEQRMEATQGMGEHGMSKPESTKHGSRPDGAMETSMDTGPSVDMRAMSPSTALSDPGPRLRGNGRRVLTYADLHTVGGPIDQRGPRRDIELHLTGNMRRFIWGFDGKKYSEAQPVRFQYGERLRIVLTNDTMMTHPIHLHGMWSEVVDENGGFHVRKHTVQVNPGQRIAYLVTADAPGQWAFHCHLLYHMEAGMFRKMVVS